MNFHIFKYKLIYEKFDNYDLIILITIQFKKNYDNDNSLKSLSYNKIEYLNFSISKYEINTHLEINSDLRYSGSKSLKKYFN